MEPHVQVARGDVHEVASWPGAPAARLSGPGQPGVISGTAPAISAVKYIVLIRRYWEATLTINTALLGAALAGRRPGLAPPLR